MKNLNKYLLTFIGFCLFFSGICQERIDLQKAIEWALLNNNNVQISRNNVEISNNLANPGQAGLLPTLSASGSVSYANNDTKFEITNSPEIIESKGATSTQLNAGVNLNYTLFSGFANKNSYSKLKMSAAAAHASGRTLIENIILQVATAYYNLLRTEQNLKTVEENFSISSDRLEQVKSTNEWSGGNSLSVLKADVDLNQDRVSLMNAELARDESIINFNRLTGRDMLEPVSLVQETEITFSINLEDCMSLMNSQNQEMLAAKLSEQVSALDWQIAKSAYLPKLDFKGGYSYSRSDAEGSFLKTNQSIGYNASLSLSLPIFAANTRKTAINNAQVLLQNAKLSAEEMQLNLEKQMLLAHRNFENSVAVWKQEKLSVETAELNFNYTEEQFQQGLVAGVDFRNAQLNVLLANNSLNNAMFNAKLAELELLRLTGQLLNEH